MKDEQIGACIRMAMAKTQMSNKDLAARLGKTRQTAHSYSQGRCKNIDVLNDVAEACGMSYDQMMKLAD
tara:strand:+ start:129 stop:335 length:207 start_codon:yes stop_codon:yes gene_type:complete